MRLPYQLGPYTVLRLLGTGGMAEVFVARDRRGLGVERLVALKTIRPRPDPEESEGLERLFEREARVAASLSHQNLVQVYDAGRIEGMLFLAMELVEGKSLARLIKNSRLGLAQTVFIGGEILAGLAFLHQHRDLEGKQLGLVHRDVSPQNVLISYEGAVKLGDFGLAKATLEADGASQTSGGPKGKARYMAPEQAYGVTLDHRADLFSTGIIIYEMLVGRHLYNAPEKNPLQLLTLARRASIPDPMRIRPDLPSAFASFLRRSLQKNPADRFPTAEAMAAALRGCMPDLRYRASDLAGTMTSLFSDERRRENDELLVVHRLTDRTEPTIPPAVPQAEPPATVSGAMRPSRSWRRFWPLLPLGALLLLAPGIYFLWPAERRSHRATQTPIPAQPDAHIARARLRVDAAITPAATAATEPVVSQSRGADAAAPRAWPGQGLISVGAQPWARVYLDGHYLGNTPLVDRRVRAGRHLLRVMAPTSGRSQRIEITVPPRKHFRRVFDLR